MKNLIKLHVNKNLEFISVSVFHGIQYDAEGVRL